MKIKMKQEIKMMTTISSYSEIPDSTKKNPKTEIQFNIQMK